MNIEPVITLSYYTGTIDDLVDEIKYLTLPVSSGDEWALLREMDGYEEPFDVKYFEYGNEQYHGNHWDVIDEVDPFAFAEKYIELRDKVKAINPDIKIGIPLYREYPSIWTSHIINSIPEYDFPIIHIYPATSGNEVSFENAFYNHDLVERVFSQIHQTRENIEDLYELVKPKKFAVTEYRDFGFLPSGDKFDHTFVFGLVLADLTMQLIRYSDIIEIAHHWYLLHFDPGIIKYENNQVCFHPEGVIHRFLFKHVTKEQYVMKLDESFLERYQFPYDSVVEDGVLFSPDYNYIKDGIDFIIGNRWTFQNYPDVVHTLNKGEVTIEFNNFNPISFWGYFGVYSIPFFFEKGKRYHINGYIKSEDLHEAVDSKFVLGIFEASDFSNWIKTTSEYHIHLNNTLPRFLKFRLEVEMGENMNVRIGCMRYGDSNLSGKVIFKDVVVTTFDMLINNTLWKEETKENVVVNLDNEIEITLSDYDLSSEYNGVVSCDIKLLKNIKYKIDSSIMMENMNEKVCVSVVDKRNQELLNPEEIGCASTETAGFNDYSFVFTPKRHITTAVLTISIKASETVNIVTGIVRVGGVRITKLDSAIDFDNFESFIPPIIEESDINVLEIDEYQSPSYLSVLSLTSDYERIKVIVINRNTSSVKELKLDFNGKEFSLVNYEYIHHDLLFKETTCEGIGVKIVTVDNGVDMVDGVMQFKPHSIYALTIIIHKRFWEKYLYIVISVSGGIALLVLVLVLFTVVCCVLQKRKKIEENKKEEMEELINTDSSK